MFGCIVVILVVLGMWVVCGVLLLVFEVMKMEYILQVLVDGVVQGYWVKVGDQVGDGVVLVDFEVDQV